MQIDDWDSNGNHTMVIGPHFRVVIQISELVTQIQIYGLDDHHTMLIRPIFGVVIRILCQTQARP